MKRFLYTIALLLVVFTTSCGKKGIYLYVGGGVYKIQESAQEAIVSFPDDDFASVIQINTAQTAFQTMNGTYTAKGHNLDLLLGDNSVHLVRTFSHIKSSSKNKNLIPMKPTAPGDMTGSVWAVAANNNFYFAWFRPDGRFTSGRYYNITRQEGIPYKWLWSIDPYTINGNQITSDGFSGTFYEGEALMLQTLSVPHVTDLAGLASFNKSELTGTVWTGYNGVCPAVIIFTSDTEFTRLVVSSATVFTWTTGTYELNGSSLTMWVGELSDECSIADGTLTFFERKYTWVEELEELEDAL